MTRLLQKVQVEATAKMLTTLQMKIVRHDIRFISVEESLTVTVVVVFFFVSALFMSSEIMIGKEFQAVLPKMLTDFGTSIAYVL